MHNMKVKRQGLKDNMFKLPQQGEFVHGDFSRTVPNVGSLLGCSSDILALDVEEV